jgi:hypothetical protein
MPAQRNLKKTTVPIYDLQIPVSPNNTFPVQFRIRTEDGSKISAWSNVYDVAAPEVIGGDTLTIKVKGSKVNIAWEDDNNRLLYDVFVHRFADIDLDVGSPARSVLTTRPTSTTAQIVLYNSNTRNDSTKQEHHLKVGMRIAVSNMGADFNIADTYVVSVPDPYTFIYSPVPTTNIDLTPNTDTNGEIIIHASTPDILSNISEYDFVFAGRTNKNTFSVNKGSVVAKSPSGNSATYTATDIWCLVQVASSDKKANDQLDIATAHLAV